MDFTEWIQMILAAIGGYYMDEENAKKTISPLDALTGNESKGVYGVSNRVDDKQSLFKNTMSGENQNPQITDAMTNLQNQVTTPGEAPQINDTLRNNLTGPNQMLPQLTSMLTTNQGRRTMRRGTVDSLLSRINQRMGTRNQNTGSLTPLGQ